MNRPIYVNHLDESNHATTRLIFLFLLSQELTKDTRRFRFELENPEQRLGLPVGQHVHLIEELAGNMVIRAYTPTTSDDTKGHFELVIKVYFKEVNPKFPEGGKMTQHLESLKIGDKVKVKGPTGRIQYKGNGKFAIRKDKKSEPVMYQFERIGLIAGGSGVTPMYQLMQAITSDPEDRTQVHLLFANQSEDDILLRKEIEQMAEQHPDRIKFWYTVDKSSPEWTYSTGFIDADMIEKHLPAADDKTGIFMCGPPPMISEFLTSSQKSGSRKTNFEFLLTNQISPASQTWRS